ncbi:MAG: Hsp20/alpha crystallin family protein [Clostridiales bacterium]|nr:Hsp20/alpha crystallin family protein [Clostridiales bacterium]
MANYLIKRNNGSTFDLLDDAFNSFFKPMFYEEKYNVMKTDIRENEKAYLMDVDLAGYDKKDISLSLEKGYLTISAEKKECADTKENYIRRERSCSVTRSYYVGEVNKELIKAKYENGVLEIEIPKKEKEIPTAHSILID